MLSKQIISLSLLLASTNACFDHNIKRSWKRNSRLQARQSIPGAAAGNDWSFFNAVEWSHVNPDYALCEYGSMQSPLYLYTSDGYSSAHVPTFNYPNELNGTLANWGYGPDFTADQSGGITSLPSFTFEEDGQQETVYLIEWHTHEPSEHVIDDVPTTAELHLVHATADGTPRAVVGIFLSANDTATEPNLFTNLPRPLPDGNHTQNITWQLGQYFQFSNFWTYKGSLTVPPCTEGLRWFVSATYQYLSTTEMQDILKVSRWSVRPAQIRWQQDVNQ